MRGKVVQSRTQKLRLGKTEVTSKHARELVAHFLQDEAKILADSMASRCNDT